MIHCQNKTIDSFLCATEVYSIAFIVMRITCRQLSQGKEAGKKTSSRTARRTQTEKKKPAPDLHPLRGAESKAASGSLGGRLTDLHLERREA